MSKQFPGHPAPGLGLAAGARGCPGKGAAALPSAGQAGRGGGGGARPLRPGPARRDAAEGQRRLMAALETGRAGAAAAPAPARARQGFPPAGHRHRRGQRDLVVPLSGLSRRAWGAGCSETSRRCWPAGGRARSGPERTVAGAGAPVAGLGPKPSPKCPVKTPTRTSLGSPLPACLLVVLMDFGLFVLVSQPV